VDPSKSKSKYAMNPYAKSSRAPPTRQGEGQPHQNMHEVKISVQLPPNVGLGRGVLKVMSCSMLQVIHPHVNIIHKS
jgi:hypothetical protein